MSYGIIRVQKFKRQAVTGIQQHNQRLKDHSNTNPDIDFSKSGENYSLEGEGVNFSAEVSKRLVGVSGSRWGTIRRDAVVMSEALVTSDRAFFASLTPEKQKAFFSDALSFLRTQYGRENIFSAVVHLDETTPHMHVTFTPIQRGKLTAKTLFSRTALSGLQTAFFEQVGKKWGLERGEKHVAKRRHLDVADYKRATDFQLETLSISAEEAEAKIVKKGLLSATYESGESIAERLNRKYVWPLARALQEAQQEKKLWHERANFREHLFQEQKELQKGLSPDRIERLRQGIKALSDALKREQQEEREQLHTRQKTRARMR